MNHQIIFHMCRISSLVCRRSSLCANLFPIRVQRSSLRVQISSLRVQTIFPPCADNLPRSHLTNKLLVHRKIERMSKQSKSLLLNDLEAKLEILDEEVVPLQSSCTIYKVPQQLRRVNQLAHTPSVVSIGPYHYGDSRLESMEQFKLWYFKKFLKRISNGNPLNVLFEAVKEKEDKIRRCYSENIKINSDDFVTLIMIDAAFIIEFLSATCDLESEDDLWTAKPWTSYLMLDLVLLENQIPYFVLEILFNLATFPGIGCVDSFVKFAFESYFLKHIYPGDQEIVAKRLSRTDNTRSFHKTVRKRINIEEKFRPLHFCDLLRKFYGSRSIFPKFGKLTKCSYGVSQLQDAGFKFEVDHKNGIIDLHCVKEKKLLKIPSLKITNWTEILLRNVIAFEQCHYPFERTVTHYILLLDCMINTEKDVEILVEKGIMHSLVDNDKVAAMVNKLSDNVSATHIGLCYADVYQMFSKCYDNTYYKNKATFIRQYWSTPWKKLSLLAGIILLFLSLTQTICSIMSLIK